MNTIAVNLKDDISITIGGQGGDGTLHPLVSLLAILSVNLGLCNIYDALKRAPPESGGLAR